MAKKSDKERAEGRSRSSLHGLPIIVKGHMATDATLGQPTSAGAYALQNATAREDSFLVAQARRAGIIILGKANLGEMGGNKDKAISIGWSALGGETMNPYDSEHPCGSSGGSAVGVAAGFVPFSIGTETYGSISCPASFTSTYALKASTGMLSRSGILPLSTTYDCPGLFAKSALDIASLLTVLAGPDPQDEETLTAQSHMEDFTKGLDSQWSDWRIGVADHKWFFGLAGFSGNAKETADEKKMLKVAFSAVEKMKALGATMIDNVTFPSAHLAHSDAPELSRQFIKYESSAGFEKFMTLMTRTEIKTLADVLDFNSKHPDKAFSPKYPGQSHIEDAVNFIWTEADHENALARAHSIGVEQGIIYALDKYKLDALVLPAWTEMSIYAAFAKAPTATVPLGKYDTGKPYGLGFVARRFDDKKLLQLMSLYEKTHSPHIVPERMRWRRWDWFTPPAWRGYL